MENMEHTGMETEQMADQQDAFLSGWDGSETQTADQPEADGADKAASAEDPSEAAETGTDGSPESDAETEAEQQDADGGRQGAENGDSTGRTWAIRHNGTERTISADEITPELLQKGVDYDRIREKYDEAKPVMEVFSGLAKANGMTVTDYVRTVRAALKRAEGLNDEEASRAIALEDREAAVTAREAEQRENEEAASRQSARINSDLEEFAKAFPDVFKQAEADPKTIPASVWDDVRSGLSLTAAYSRYAVERANSAAREAQEQAKAAALNQKNSARSAGSMQSAGNDTHQKDAFLEGWDS